MCDGVRPAKASTAPLYRPAGVPRPALPDNPIGRVADGVTSRCQIFDLVDTDARLRREESDRARHQSA
jgi:hypothetical protein